MMHVQSQIRIYKILSAVLVTGVGTACGNAPNAGEVAVQESEVVVSMDCTHIPVYTDIPSALFAGYPAGYQVQSEGSVYECLYGGGWCGQTVYAPPAGWAWSYAWRLAGTCGTSAPPTDPCEGQADGTVCDDGNSCTVGDVCMNDVCVSGLVASCDASCPAFDDCTGLSCGETNACGNTCGQTCDAGCPDAGTPICMPTCGSAPSWTADLGYQVGDQVESAGQIYECKIAGWCDQTPYEPGLGWAWENAWLLIGDCP